MTDFEKRPFENKRDAMLTLTEVGETLSSFGYCYRLCQSLKHNTVTPEQFTLLSGDLQLHCQINKIETENEICSLF